MDFNAVLQAIQMGLVSILGAIVDGIAAIAGLLPNPDPFPAIFENIDIDGGTEAAAIAFGWIDEFFDVGAIATVFALWLGMFAVAWIIMMLWRWAHTVE